MAGMEEEAYNDLRALLRLFKERGLEELVVEEGGFKLRLSRRSPEAGRGPAAEGRRPRAGRAVGGPVEERQRGKGRTVAVRAPLIGVFYRAAAPDAPPFVEIGDVVREGDTVCIVEAMKVFNEIKAEWNGRVVAIPAETGRLVQAGDPLVVLEFLEAAEAEEEG